MVPKREKTMLVKIQSLAVVLFVGLVDSVNAQTRRRAPRYVEPLWFSRVEAEDETGLLNRCMKRTRKDAPPKDGDPCSRRPKMCYFGTQDCDGVGAHPEIMCFCDGQDGTMKWQCEEGLACPVFPNPTKTGCPAEFSHDNDASCPEEQPAFGDSCQSTSTCSYGSNTCCGMCHKRFSTTCKCGVDLDGWYCRIPEGCGFFGSPCGFRHYEDNPFEAQIGGSCIEARTAIFAVWPGMTVICQAQSNPRPITRDTNRYIILLDDDTGAVTSIHFDLAPLTSCPVNPTSASGMPCDIPFEESCIQPGGSSFKRGTELCTRRASRCYCQELGGCGIAKLQCRVPFVDCVTLDPPAPRGSPP